MLSKGNVGFPSSKVGKKTPPSILVEFFFTYINKQDWVTDTDRVPAETILWLGQESILLVPLPLQVLAKKTKLEKLSKKNECTKNVSLFIFLIFLYFCID